MNADFQSPVFQERFWRKVKQTTGCWFWTGATKPEPYAYGNLRRNGRSYLAHRVAYELTYGDIDEGLFICHHCDTPTCVRPDHLFAGTTTENMQDARIKGRTASGERNGSRKHPERRPRGENHPSRLHPGYMPKGERHPQAKLSEGDVRSICKRYENGETQPDLAREYGISQASVSCIVLGKSWTYLRPEGKPAAPRRQGRRPRALVGKEEVVFVIEAATAPPE